MERHPEHRHRTATWTLQQALVLGCLSLALAAPSHAAPLAVARDLSRIEQASMHGDSRFTPVDRGVEGPLVGPGYVLPGATAPMPRLTSRRSRAKLLACAAGLADKDDCVAAAAVSGMRADAGAAEDGQRLSIAGRVVATDGTGVAGVTLIATPIIVATTAAAGPAGDRARSASTSASASVHIRYRTVSAANGAYAFPNLPTGSYTIRSNRHDSYPSVRISARAGFGQADIVLRSE